MLNKPHAGIVADAQQVCAEPKANARLVRNIGIEHAELGQRCLGASADVVGQTRALQALVDGQALTFGNPLVQGRKLVALRPDFLVTALPRGLDRFAPAAVELGGVGSPRAGPGGGPPPAAPAPAPAR